RVVRRGSREDERRARSGPLGGPTLEGPSPPCTYDDDRLRLPSASTPRSSKAGKKESTGHRLNRPCQPCATLSSNSSLGYHRSDAPTAENGFATSSGVRKSAKGVLEAVSKTGPGGRSWSTGTGSDRPVPRLSKRVSRLKNEALDEMRNQRLFPDWLRDEIPIRELPRDRLDPRPPLDR